MTPLVIRTAQLKDASALTDFYPHWGLERCRKRIKKSNSSSSQLRLVAVLDGKVVGHILAKSGHMHHAHVATLYSLIVKPSKRGKGIATKLVKKAVEMLPAETELLLLQTQHDNTTAQGFFKKLGFKEYGYLPKAFKRNNKYKDNILLYKSIQR